MNDESALVRLARLAGLEPAYRDALGGQHVVGEATTIALLKAMRIAADSPDAIAESLRRLEDAPWRCLTDPVVVLRADGEARATMPISVRLPASQTRAVLRWKFKNEQGADREGEARVDELPVSDRRSVDGTPFERRTLTLPGPLIIGRHRVELYLESGERGEVTVIVAPPRCYLPPGDPRLWGVTLQLYGLRSATNWGIGDFADVERLVGTMAPLGAAAIGLNPLHAMFPNRPNHRSPYSPSHREFLAIHYLAPEAMDDFAECEAARRAMADENFHNSLAMARQDRFVDYERVLALKHPIFELLFRSFRERHLGHAEDSRARAFDEFLVHKGEALRRFAIFEALSEHFHRDFWRKWPPAYHDPESGEVAAFAEAHEERITYHAYLQWQAERQACRVQMAARAAGMALGLYHDLALAPDASGAEAWANQSLFAHGATLGAPPDPWNQLGQNWGLPPYDPAALRRDSYRQMAGVMRAVMSHGGAMRVDHVIGLQRMFWIPEGASAAEGAYVRYPVDDLFAVLALESTREKCLIVGEDLGNLPEGFHHRMAAAGMLSYRLLYFAQDEQGEFCAPHMYPPHAAVAVTTHDLATLPGYWRAVDLQVREKLAQFPSERMRDASFELRGKDRIALIRALKREGLIPSSVADDSALTIEIMEAVYRLIARTPSLLMLLSLEDVAWEEEQANLPGTVDQHPNWQRKLSLSLEDMAASEVLRRLARAIAEEGRARHDRP